MSDGVKNRDIIELHRVWYVMQRIVSLEERRKWQRERCVGIQAKLGQRTDGGEAYTIADAAVAMDELDRDICEQIRRYTRELKKSEKIINEIPNENMRVFVQLMYLDGISGAEVRERLNMTRTGFERAKRAVEGASRMRDVVWHDRYYLEE